MSATVSTIMGKDLLSSCVHCGFCLEVCPTYQLTGDENNSPRGRLRLWRQEAEGKIPQDKWTTFYTSECVGCLACEPACPANVPYGHILEETRHAHVAGRRWLPKPELRLAAAAVARTKFFDTALLPARALRSVGLLPHPLVFPSVTPVFQSTAAYAKELMERHRPTGPRVALLTGCLMEALFREINFATVRVLVANNVQVVVPEGQGCCGAFQEHTGIDGVGKLREVNRRAFSSLGVECAVTNSAGCGLSLQKTLDGELPVRDVLGFLGEIGIKPREPRGGNSRVYVDLPCHLVHGQRSTIPVSVLDATGYRWEFAPCAKDCCGSGGIYNIQKKENAREILAKKSAFLKEAEGDPVILATSNHVCMMQWNSARWGGMVRKPFYVRHVIQLLDSDNQSHVPSKRGRGWFGVKERRPTFRQ
jgi:glycolate oxidase iron-sulfur subunit